VRGVVQRTRPSDESVDQLSVAAPPPQDLFHKTHPYAKAPYIAPKCGRCVPLHSDKKDLPRGQGSHYVGF